MAKWITSLDKTHWLKENIFSAIRNAAGTVSSVRDSENVAKGIMVCDNVIESRITDIDLGKGSVTINVELENCLFYKILGETTGLEITCESDLMPILLNLNKIKRIMRK